MKKFKLFALAAFALLSTNAFAVEVGTKFAGANGVMYQVSKAFTPANPGAGTDAAPGEVVVVAYSQSATTAAVTIPSTIQNTNNAIIADVPLENIYTVVGIAEYGKDYANNADAEVTVFVGAKSASITLPATVKNIGANAFKNCEAATIVIPTGSQLMTIGDNAFEGCAKLATFATANATLLNSIGAEAFKGCAALTTFTAGQFLQAIGAGAFKGTGIATLDLSVCKNFTTANGAIVGRWFTDDAAAPNNQYNVNETLTTVILPTALATPATDVLAIDANAFKGCAVLTTIGATANTIAIPAYVSAIGAGAFLKTGITVFDLSANAAINAFDAWFTTTVPNTSTATLAQIVLNKTFDGSDAAKTYTIGTNLQNISSLAKIGTVDDEFQLPKGVTLAAGIFAGTGLTKLDLSKYDTDDMALPALFGAGIATLAEVKLNAKTTELDAKAFYNCSALATLNNIDKLKTIGNGAFYRTAIASFAFGAGLTAASFGTNTPFVPALAADILKETDGVTEKPYSLATSLSIDLSKSANVVAIVANSFKGLSMLTEVKLPAALTTIGQSAFEGTGIASIELPATITQDGVAANRGLKENAFKDCKSLKTVSFEPAAANASIFQYDGNDATPDDVKNVFKGCSLVKFETTTEYAALFGNAPLLPIPVNVVMDKAASKEIATKLDKKTKGYAMKGFYDAANSYKIKTADVTTVYEAYINDGDVVLSRLKKKGEYYEIPAGLAVIVRTVEEATINPIKDNGIVAPGSSLLTLAGNELKSVAADNTDKPEANYIYALTNKAGEGFAFSFYTGAKLNNGNIYVVNSKAPSASGRLNIIFLDENGNVEYEATAIQSIETENEDAPAYNLAGQKVNASYKGVVIKNGKKYIK